MLPALGLLAACQGQPATTESPAAQAPSAQPAGADGTAYAAPPIALAPQDTLLGAGGASSEKDVPALHEPFEVVKKAGGGLAVIIAAVPVAPGTLVRDPGDLRITFTITRQGKIIYRDSLGDGWSYTKFSEPPTEKLYPLWLPTGPGAGELLMAYNNRPSRDQARRFFIRGNRVVKLDTLPTFDEPARDLDHDGRPEYHGLPDYGEAYDDEQGRHRSTYNPTLYYEVRPTGLVLDSALTRRQARAKYGSFYGFRYSEKSVILAK